MHDNIFTDWLTRRNIRPEILKEFSIRSGQYGAFGECIIIPIKNIEGNFIFNKYRRSPLTETGSKYMYDVGGTVTLYAGYKIKDAPTVLICEGEMDALVAWSHNIAAVSSTGGAQSFQKEWATYLEGKEVYVCLDNDIAGGEGMAKIIDIIPTAKIVFLPDRPGLKDITDYVQQGGDLNALLKSAITFTSLESIIEHKSRRIALWQSTFFHDAYIKNHEPKKKFLPTKAGIIVGEDKLSKAKAFPISSLIEINHESKAVCLWHAEKTSSLHYYEYQNKVYCFGCGKRADAIDIYQKLHNCSFLEAVNKLTQ